MGLTLLADAWGCWSLIFYSCLHDIPKLCRYTYICLSLIGLQCLLSLVDITSFCFFLIAWQLKWQVYSGSCLFFPFCYPKKYDAMSLGSHERARYRSICYLWFRWSLFGVDWSIIQKLTVLHMNMDCFSCSQPLLLYLFIYLLIYLFIYLFITTLFVIINTKRLPSGGTESSCKMTP